MNGKSIQLDPCCPCCKMKDNEILKLKKESRELQDRYFAIAERYIALIEEKNGITSPNSDKKTHLRVV